MALRAELLLLAAILASVALAAPNVSVQQQWVNFKAQYNRFYASPAEEAHRFAVFQSNLVAADALTKREQGRATFGVTKFMDLTPEEFKQHYLSGLRHDAKPSGGQAVAPFAPQALPTSFSWVAMNATTAVKNQEQCGSCWAFSATEQIESMYYLEHSKTLAAPPVLAPQQIVDCDGECYGCDGGWPSWAFDYVKATGGLDTEASYPYEGVNQNCSFNSADVAASITGWSWVSNATHKNETQMLYYVATTGPLSICVDASSWQYYLFGVISIFCGKEIDHAVQIVGYGHDDIYFVDYWLVRNSWGPDWGEKGYVKVARGYDLCAISQMVTTVTTVTTV